MLGGQAEAIAQMLDTRYQSGLSVDDALRLGASVLGENDGPPLAPEQLEVAVLQRGVTGRAFRRVKGDELGRVLTG